MYRRMERHPLMGQHRPGPSSAVQSVEPRTPLARQNVNSPHDDLNWLLRLVVSGLSQPIGGQSFKLWLQGLSIAAVL